MFADRKFIKIKKAVPCTTFRSEGNYEHSSIVEVSFGDRIIAYDMADGYQSIHRMDVLDSQLLFQKKLSTWLSYRDEEQREGQTARIELSLLL